MMANAENLAGPRLPADLLHLLAAELSDRLDFATLYSCVVAGKQFANAGAVAGLYRYYLNPCCEKLVH